MSLHLVFVHGFLGQPSFWDATIDALKDSSIKAHAPALFGPYSLQGFYSVEEWTENFYRYSLQISKSPMHLVGYSMGGRLLLEFASRYPDRVKSLCLISSRPDLLPNENRLSRRKWELMWAEKALDLDWDHFLKEWSDQEIFQGSSPVHFKETEGLREELSLALINWSVTQSRFSWSNLERLKVPNLWLFGERDKKYLQVEQLIRQQSGASLTEILIGGGHRLPIDQPKEVARLIEKWLRRPGG